MMDNNNLYFSRIVQLPDSNRLMTGALAGISGFVTGGLSGGIDAAIHGKHFFTGQKPYFEAEISNYETILQRDNVNCKNASLASIEKLKGGNRTYDDFINLEKTFKKTLPFGGEFGYDIEKYFEYTGLNFCTAQNELENNLIYELGNEISNGNPIMLLKTMGKEEGYHAVTMFRVRQWTPSSPIKIWYGDPLLGKTKVNWDVLNFIRAYIFY